MDEIIKGRHIIIPEGFLKRRVCIHIIVIIIDRRIINSRKDAYGTDPFIIASLSCASLCFATTCVMIIILLLVGTVGHSKVRILSLVIKVIKFIISLLTFPHAVLHKILDESDIITTRLFKESGII